MTKKKNPEDLKRPPKKAAPAEAEMPKNNEPQARGEASPQGMDG